MRTRNRRSRLAPLTGPTSRTPSQILKSAQQLVHRRQAIGRRKSVIGMQIGASVRQIDLACVFRDFLPDLTERAFPFAWSCCPFHNDRHPSFCVNLETGSYKCFSTACTETGGNIVSFVSALQGISSSEARRYLERHYG